ncbi:MAG: hypothetical protein WAW17_14010 [Rhodococcus sp. (in: high G+C Gram-positive bacteria)]|uniref:hypothetical protein n=1 Tax=Rhodococcus sp. TaxID=1831 RepID=UPI003BAFDD8A
MTVHLIDQESIRDGAELAVQRPMGAEHAQALAQVAREFYERTDPHAETESLESNITLDDGDLIWHIGGGYDILFTVVDVSGAHDIRAMVRGSVGWVTVADHSVDPRDAVCTAQTVWQLILRLTD